MNIGQFIVPLGATAFGLLVITILLSVFRRLKPRPMLMLHKISGFATLAAAVGHLICLMLVGGD